MRLIPVAVLAAAACALAACSSSGSAPSSSAPPTSVASTASTSAVPTTSTPPPTTSAAPSTTASSTVAPSTSSPPPTSASRAPSAPTFTTTCRSLSVDVVRGGAIRGMEIAAMQFTNNGSSPCVVTGVPTATLLRNGATVGNPSKPNSDTVSPFTIRPGEYGEALLRDFSTCNAPLSDNLRLQGPSRNGKAGKTITQPIKLRACKLEVAPVGEPS